jgi:hypothetical protein
VGSGYRHGKAHEVNAASQGDDCLNRADPHSLTVQVTVSNLQEEHLQRLLDETQLVPAVNQIELHP